MIVVLDFSFFYLDLFFWRFFADSTMDSSPFFTTIWENTSMNFSQSSNKHIQVLGVFFVFFVTLNHGIFTTKNRFLVRER